MGLEDDAAAKHLKNKGEQDMYSSKVMEHFMMPRNACYLANADGVGCIRDAQCGDKFTMFIRVCGGIITNACFVTFGCGAAIASGSLTTILVKGKSIDDALKITGREVIEALGGLPEDKHHCCELCVNALRAAIRDYLARQGGAMIDASWDAEAW
jgi:NifU homolog involved in Fe-S cluster formation